jgi:hypothetical protein
MTLFSIILFLFIYFGIYYVKPSFIFLKDGSIRTFGVGYKQKTILPLWLLTILLAIVCYLIIVFYVNSSKISF